MSVQDSALPVLLDDQAEQQLPLPEEVDMEQASEGEDIIYMPMWMSRTEVSPELNDKDSLESDDGDDGDDDDETRSIQLDSSSSSVDINLDEEQQQQSAQHYQLQQASATENPIAVGSFVYAPWPMTKKNLSSKHPKHYWGNVILPKEEGTAFDVRFPDQLTSKNVPMDQMFTLESSAYKNGCLALGDIVYAAWPGTGPENDSFYWGRISKIFNYPPGNKKKYNIHFFPDGPYVDTTERLDPQYLHRREEAYYLMEQQQLHTIAPPTELLSLEELVAMQRLAKHQRPASKPQQSTKKKARTSKTRKVMTSAGQKRTATTTAAAKKKKVVTAKRASTAAAAKKKKRVGKTKHTQVEQSPPIGTRRRQKTPPRHASGYQLLRYDAAPLETGDLVYAPWPNEDPLHESWWWGTIGETYNTAHVDVHFADGDVSRNVWHEHLYKLETQAYKDSVAKVGDVVYAPFPGKNPKLESYYWGRISKISKTADSDSSENGGTSLHSVYSIDFPDGDETENITSVHFHQYNECMYLMKKGWMMNDEPPPTLLRTLRI